MTPNQYRLESIDTLDTRQFVMAVRRLADSLSFGTDASPYVGTGVEYAQSRLYEPGDPVRAMDWRVTARTQKYHIREYETPRRMPVYLIVDTSASMTVHSSARSKYALAVHLAGSLAFASLDRISPVALIGAGERDIRYTPRLSRDRILEWLHQLRTYRVDEKTRLARRLVELGPSLLNRSLVIVLSDLNEPDAIDPLKKLAQHHDCVAIQLRDPAEDGLRGVGFLRGQEAETGRMFVSRGRRPGVDQLWIQSELRRARVDHLVLRTDEPVTRKLRHFFRARGRSGRGAR